ncbi:MAG: helix-turn-helix domain-containing protein, partial [Rhodocyclaceae bacterium]|nr:helix-turn-helix domain-containing protein [Rhodocyclaceae bacterium]
MITMNMLGKIRRLKLRDGLSISEICRRTGLARNTVRRWLNSAEGTEPKY